MYYFLKSVKQLQYKHLHVCTVHVAMAVKKEKRNNYICHRRFWSLHDLIRSAGSTFVLAKTKTAIYAGASLLGWGCGVGVSHKFLNTGKISGKL